MLDHGLILAIGASVAHATTDAARKGLTRRLDPGEALCGFVLLGVPLIAAIWLFAGKPGLPLQGGFFLYLALSVAPNLLANALFFEAVRVSPLSLTLPFLAFTPALLVGTSWLLNRELPSAIGTAGIGLILLGTFLLRLDALRDGIAGPLRAVLQERGSLLMLAVATIWALSAAADKAAVVRSGPLSYYLLWHLAMAIPLAIWLLFRASRLRALAAQVVPAAGTAALHVLAGSLQMAALPLLPASYVIAIKRAGMLLGIVYGRVLFGERDLAQRLLGAAVMLLGVLCITLG
jgi:drug/metabolite transporter (DMT)-like permease